MAIKILIDSRAIQGKEDDLIKQDLIKILEENGDKVKTSNLEDTKNGKWFNAQLENRNNEQEIVNDIINKSIKLYDKIDIEPKTYYELIIKNIPNSLNAKSLKDELKKLLKSHIDTPRIPDKKRYAFITVNNLDEANDLITNLNNQYLLGKNLKVEFAELKQYQKRERTSLTSDETVQRKTVETKLYGLGAFYEERDYDMVTKKLTEFVYGVCTYLSNLPPQQNFTQIEQEQNDSNL